MPRRWVLLARRWILLARRGILLARWWVGLARWWILLARRWVGLAGGWVATRSRLLVHCWLLGGRVRSHLHLVGRVARHAWLGLHGEIRWGSWI